jgi:N-acetylmuramoyl-L-alanine amidase
MTTTAALLLAASAWGSTLRAVDFTTEEDGGALILSFEQPAAVSGGSLAPMAGQGARYFVDIAPCEVPAELLAARFVEQAGQFVIEAPAPGVDRLRMSPWEGGQWRLVLDLGRAEVSELSSSEEGRVWRVRWTVPEGSLSSALGTPTPDPPPPSDGGSGTADDQGGAVSVSGRPLTVVRSNERGGVKIVLDPGHGGEDVGAPGIEGSAEADVVLGLCLELAAILEARGHEVVLTRDIDVFVPLQRRPIVANSEGARLFVSVHANSSESREPVGIETYYLNYSTDAAAARVAARENAALGGSPTIEDSILQDLLRQGSVEQSRYLAHAIQDATVAQLGAFYGARRIEDRGVKTALFAVLVGARMPAVLLEIGFISNPKENRRMRSRGFQRLFAQATADGIEAYLAGAPP